MRILRGCGAFQQFRRNGIFRRGAFRVCRGELVEVRQIGVDVAARYANEHRDALSVEERGLEDQGLLLAFGFRRDDYGGSSAYRLFRLRDYFKRRAAFDFPYLCERELRAFLWGYVFSRRRGDYESA